MQVECSLECVTLLWRACVRALLGHDRSRVAAEPAGSRGCHSLAHLSPLGQAGEQASKQQQYAHILIHRACLLCAALCHILIADPLPSPICCLPSSLSATKVTVTAGCPSK